ncbi:MAG: hypothetical protein ACPGUD_13690 [Parashewanella sp.]
MKVMIFSILLGVSIIGLYALKVFSPNPDVAQNSRKQTLNSLKVAIHRANERVHQRAQNENADYGSAEIEMNGVQVGVLNGYLKATQIDIDNGMDLLFDAKDSTHSASSAWVIDEQEALLEEPAQVIVHQSEAPDNCFLMYTEAGVINQPAPATSIVVDSGC